MNGSFFKMEIAQIQGLSCSTMFKMGFSEELLKHENCYFFVPYSVFSLRSPPFFLGLPFFIILLNVLTGRRV